MKFLITIGFLLLSLSSSAQRHATGLLFDDGQFKNDPMHPHFMTGDYLSLPSSFSLKRYCPIPGKQLQLNTSVGWATSYGAKTIIQARLKNWTNPRQIALNSFSPSFIYHLAKDETDRDCAQFVTLSKGLKALKEKGSPRFNDFLYFCPHSIKENDWQNARNSPKVGYARLFDLNEDPDHKIKAIKKSLSEGFPVVAGMYTPPSFSIAKSFWQPREKMSLDFPGHAITVIGYDDNQFGGAFELMNSWGKNWGNEGFMWIRYPDFNEFVRYAYEVFESPERGQEEPDLSGEISFQEVDGNPMQTKPTSRKGYYEMTRPYKSGTKFRILVSNNEPAFVYALSSDATGEVYELFPYRPWISPALPYESANVALPSEKGAFQMDNTLGTDYFCFIYSKEELVLTELVQEVKSKPGTFQEKIKMVLRDKLLENENVIWEKDGIGFSGNSRGKTMIAIIIEIEHI